MTKPGQQEIGKIVVDGLYNGEYPWIMRAYTDCVLMGIDPRNGSWVTGPDGLLYTADDNFLGDLTVATPFELLLQANIPAAAVQGEYDAVLYIEISPAP